MQRHATQRVALCHFCCAAGGVRVQHSSEDGSSSSAWGACTCLPACCGFSSTEKLPCSVRWPVGRAQTTEATGDAPALARTRAAYAPCTTKSAMNWAASRASCSSAAMRPASRSLRDCARTSRAQGKERACASARGRRTRLLILGANLLLRRRQRPRVAAKRLAAHAQQLAVRRTRSVSERHALRGAPAGACARSCRCAAANEPRACTASGGRQQAEAGPPAAQRRAAPPEAGTASGTAA